METERETHISGSRENERGRKSDCEKRHKGREEEKNRRRKRMEEIK